jgi:uncharacterized protein (UPF0276 family)
MPSITTAPSLATTVATEKIGFGLGLRTPHYQDFLSQRQPVDWLEIITDNFLGDGGRPLKTLDRIRADYPIAMHGVAMSIGAASGIDAAYLLRVKTLADRIEPLWVSDHLCWIGDDTEQLHDLYPLPYTDEAARHVVAQILRAQDVLKRQLVLENVSSYAEFNHGAASEWQFLSHIAEASDCLLLLDVNNVYVSSVNHGFNPTDYLNAINPKRVKQMHLAGHSVNKNHIVDTHDHPVAQPVWDLYAAACARFGDVATMIERDDDIPALPVLLAELEVARRISADTAHSHTRHAVPDSSAATLWASAEPDLADPTLAHLQGGMMSFVLGSASSAPHEVEASIKNSIRDTVTFSRDDRLHVYHHAYRARLSSVLADSFAKTFSYIGADVFEQHARDFVVKCPPRQQSLSGYGEGLPDYLHSIYPHNPELCDLAQLDWDLRTRFDVADVDALSADSLRTGPDAAHVAEHWLLNDAPLHPSLVLREISTNVAQIWLAIDTDTEVPEVLHLPARKTIAIWRKELQPHFFVMSDDEALFVRQLFAGASIDEAARRRADAADAADTAFAQTLGQWLHRWLADGWLRGEPMATKSSPVVDAKIDTPPPALDSDVVRIGET